ncbi:MAG: hypothetical protein IJD43_09885 [Thermoguttaceae bacterium]|nr:hypothetical protein [Planctomycetaceae bacterium]MBQ4143772.1 hypothetical protein [Thermoguttaceae bacterium]
MKTTGGLFDFGILKISVRQALNFDFTEKGLKSQGVGACSGNFLPYLWLGGEKNEKPPVLLSWISNLRQMSPIKTAGCCEDREIWEDFIGKSEFF